MDYLTPLLDDAPIDRRRGRHCGYWGSGVGERGFVDPGTPFLQKPFTQNALALKVREVLGGPLLQKD
jgi:hypothetical protein